jgi:hypothetical protein
MRQQTVLDWLVEPRESEQGDREDQHDPVG